VSIGGGGAAGVSVSGGGAGASNVITVRTNAFVANSALIVRGGKSTVSAGSNADIQALIVAAAAAAGGGGAAGVGVSVGVGAAANTIGAGNQIQAYLSNASVDSDNTLDVTAVSNQTIRADVGAVSASIQGGGAAAVSVAGSGTGASNTIAVATRAYIDGDGATGITATQIALSAKDTSAITASVSSAGIAGGGAGAASVGVTVSVSMATNRIGNTVEALIRNADTGVTTTSGDLAVEAESSGSIQAIATAASVSVGGAGGVSVQVAGGGAGALNVITTSTRAAIERANGQSSLNRVTSGAGLRVGAKSSQDIDAKVVALSAAGGGAGLASVPVAIGLSGAQNIIGSWKTTDANGNRLDQPTLDTDGGARVEALIADTVATAQGSVAVTATSSSTIDATVAAASAVVTGGTVAVGVAGSGSYSGNAISFATNAAITGASTSVTAGDVTVRAKDQATINVDVGAAAIAAAGGAVGVAPAIGVAVALNVINNAVTAIVDGASVTTRTGGIRVEATVPSDNGGSSINARVAAAAVALSGGGVAVSVAGGGAIATNMIGGSTPARG
ncbi:beta strand repeat-containing protein, partial [Methylorubrum extorquens]